MEIHSRNKRFFTDELMCWHAEHNNRSLPWKEEKDPYKIWLSEIILQQTRAQQGLPYYLKFTEAYPSIAAMASAKDEEVFRIWQGLGYYNRCRNMLATARTIANEHNGKFPDRHEEILKLKGVGPYTAAAIASFAFGLPYAVVDGNVYRVLSRFFGIETPIDSTEGKKQFQELAGELLDVKNPSGYNQAIMDLGATVCTPGKPACRECPLADQCFAYKHHITGELPVKEKKMAVKHRYFHYLLLQTPAQLWIQKRSSRDIWQDLHQPYLIEHEAPLDTETLKRTPGFTELGIENPKINYEGILKQRLTHQLIESRFFLIPLKEQVNIPGKDGKWVKLDELKNLAFPGTLVSFFEKNLYF